MTLFLEKIFFSMIKCFLSPELVLSFQVIGHFLQPQQNSSIIVHGYSCRLGSPANNDASQGHTINLSLRGKSSVDVRVYMIYPLFVLKAIITLIFDQGNSRKIIATAKIYM